MRVLSHDEMARRYPGAMKATARFDARAVRDALLKRGGPVKDSFIRFAYRPFDIAALLGGGDETARRKTRRLQAACVQGECVAVRRAASAEGCRRTTSLFYKAYGFAASIERTALMFPPTSATTASESAATKYNVAPICPVPRSVISTVSAQM